MIECKICGRKFKRYVAQHLRIEHGLSKTEYYMKYLKTPDEGKCVICGKPTQFKKAEDGFYKYCSRECQNIGISKVFKYYHKEHDKFEYCPVCKKITKHTVGIGCYSCWSRNANETLVDRMQEKYGVDNVYQLPSVKEKIVNTSMERYGTSNPGNCIEGRRKAYKTMREKGNHSSWEDILEDYFKNNNILYKKQYKDDLYPFFCDFYLSETKTYIELHGFWSHSDHFFDKNSKEDLKKLKKWKDKASNGHKQYKNAIQVWTKTDLKKKKVAEENSLNYIVLWSLEDINSFIETSTV